MSNKPSAAAFAAASRQYLGRTYQEMDCQAFVEASMALVGLHKDLAGSNAWYRTMTWTGTPEECKTKFGSVPVGALLYILEQDGKEPAKYKSDGIGNASHIGIKTGDGKGAIHSSASRGNVCESEFHDKTIPNGGWNRVGLWDAFDYGDKINALLSGGSGSEQDAPDDGGDPAPVPSRLTTATVYADNGKPVKMRNRPVADDRNTTWVWVPVGATVTVRALGTDGWTPIRYNGKNGYMMDKFLQYQAEPDSEQDDDQPARDWMVRNLTEYEAQQIAFEYQAAIAEKTYG